MSEQVLAEAKRLYDMGFAILWLHPRSKRPVDLAWTSGPRKEWEELKKTYRKKMNFGVRLGTPSKIHGKYLAAIDVDVKSDKKTHLKEALIKVAEILGDEKPPCVVSGRGGGSCHYYFLTKKPFKTFTPFRSTDEVKVLMPSKNASKRELRELSKAEIANGMRLAPAWEVSFYSDGRQVVLAPSVHPDTGQNYKWKPPGLNDSSDLPHMEIEEWRGEKSNDTNRGNTNSSRDNGVGESFGGVLNPCDLAWVSGISEKTRRAIETGEGVSDRSAYLLPAASALHSAGLDKGEILYVLTDPKTFLGECAYDHAKTTNRLKAAEWVWKYTLRKVLDERDAVAAFRNAAKVERVSLTDDEAEEQALQIEQMTGWETRIERTGKNKDGPPKTTLENIVLVLTNAISKQIFERNLFANRDSYGCDAPWGSKKGDLLTDDDVPRIVYWLGHTYGFEPANGRVYDAMSVIACENAFDPVKDWLNALPAWDKKERLRTWLKRYFQAKGSDEYLAQVFTKWIGAMVVRVFEPGAKFDWVPIFEGTQGIGKSSIGRILVGDKLFLDWVGDLNNKDSALGLQGIWAVELGELAALGKNEIEVVKAFITRTVDKVRPPHGRKTMECARRCVFFGTTNREQYLRDHTGNRRFKPIEVGNLNFAALTRDREQLFSEAMELYKARKIYGGLGLELTGKAADYERVIQAEKVVEDDSNVMGELILEFLEKEKNLPENERILDPEKMTLSELFGANGPLWKWKHDSRSVQFAGRALRNLGAEKHRSNGKTKWKMQKPGPGTGLALHLALIEDF